MAETALLENEMPAIQLWVETVKVPRTWKHYQTPRRAQNPEEV
jgi:hypothetical protein